MMAMSVGACVYLGHVGGHEGVSSGGSGAGGAGEARPRLHLHGRQHRDTAPCTSTLGSSGISEACSHAGVHKGLT